MGHLISLRESDSKFRSYIYIYLFLGRDRSRGNYYGFLYSGRKICRRKFRGANALMCSPGVDREKSCERKGAGAGRGSSFVLTGRRIAEETSGISRFTSPLRGVLTPDIIVSFQRFLFLSRS